MKFTTGLSYQIFRIFKNSLKTSCTFFVLTKRLQRTLSFDRSFLLEYLKSVHQWQKITVAWSKFTQNSLATISARHLRIFVSILAVLLSWSLGEKEHFLAPRSFFIPYRSTHRIVLENMFLISVCYRRCFTRKLFGVIQKQREKTPLAPLSESLPAFNKIRLLRNTCVFL